MKVLFAVSNENISESIVKKYQKDYKEIISYKNVYYFNAILKELQKNKTYDRIVISEELEPFSNNNYDAIDKFIFEKLDSISDEALDNSGTDIPIILICTDRRSKGESILVKLFGIGVYSALLGQDRSIEQVCALIKKPRSKKEAKIYYKIDSDDVNYQSENENDVSETEIKNILAHYKKLGKNEEKYAESFESIASQYNDVQLRIICNFLPLNVKAILEGTSSKYQQLMTNAPKAGKVNTKIQKLEPPKSGIKEEYLRGQGDGGRPVIIPSAVNKKEVKKLGRTTEPQEDDNIDTLLESRPKAQPIMQTIDDDIEEKLDTIGNMPSLDQTPMSLSEQPKKGRGRPKKIVEDDDFDLLSSADIAGLPKKGRGRPKKAEQLFEQEEEPTNTPLSSFDDDDGLLTRKCDACSYETRF